MRRDEYLKLHDKDSKRIIPCSILSEFKSIMNGLGYKTDKLLDENEDMYIHVYEAPGKFPSEDDLQLSRDMARRDNAFLEKIQNFGDEYLHGFYDIGNGRYVDSKTLHTYVYKYLCTCEKYDYAKIRRIPYKKKSIFLKEKYSNWCCYYYCEWSLWLQKRVYDFMVKAIAFSLVDNLSYFYNNFDRRERIERGWETFEDYINNVSMKYTTSKEASNDPPKTYAEKKVFHKFNTHGEMEFEDFLGHADVLSKDGEYLLSIDGTSYWRQDCLTLKDTKLKIYDFIKEESIQPSVYNQGFFKLTKPEQEDIIDKLSQVIYESSVDVDYVCFEEEIERDAFRQEGAELRGKMHARF